MRIVWSVVALVAGVILVALAGKLVERSTDINRPTSKDESALSAAASRNNPPPVLHNEARTPQPDPATQDVATGTAAFTRARDAARAFLASKTNIYFDPVAFVQDALARNEHLVGDIMGWLTASPHVEGAAAPVDERPSEVLERMAAIDVLEHVARAQATADSAGEARAAMAEIVRRDLAKSLDDDRKKILVSEKYDALAALTRVDADKAFSAYVALKNPGQQQVLQPALLTGLVDSGVPRDKVDSVFAKKLALAERHN